MEAMQVGSKSSSAYRGVLQLEIPSALTLKARRFTLDTLRMLISTLPSGNCTGWLSFGLAITAELSATMAPRCQVLP